MFQVYNPDNFQRDQGVTENVKYEKNIELLFNPNESLLYLVRKTPIKI